MDFLMILESMGLLGFGLALLGNGGIMSWLGHGRHFKIGVAQIITGAIAILAMLILFNYPAFWNYIIILIVALIGLGAGAGIIGAAFLVARAAIKR